VQGLFAFSMLKREVNHMLSMETALAQRFAPHAADLHSQMVASEGAAHQWALSPPDVRAGLLKSLARSLDAERTALIALADEETHLGTTRLNGEVDRTCFQLQSLADHIFSSTALRAQDDEAIALPPPLGRPRTTRVLVPLGPVAVFSASNFPFAFSVLGGDTASALAAGCPVVVRAHPAHPRLSRAVFEVAQRVILQMDLPPGLLGLVEGDSIQNGLDLVRHPAVQAVAFTGSRQGGLALQAAARERRQPIPFFGELGSVNPVVLMPGVLAGRIEALAEQLAASVRLGMGQFCTRPSLLILAADEHTEAFLKSLSERLEKGPVHPMLTPRIAMAYQDSTKRLANTPGVSVLVQSTHEYPAPFLARVGAETLLSNPELCEEVFGPALLVVVCQSPETMKAVMAAPGGSLVHTLWGAETESPLARCLVQASLQLAGRIVFEGVPTGVAVTGAQQHGGPWPSSTSPSTTSVGHRACDRFLRPVALQQAPAWLLAQQIPS
jgi:NADP-dependent aldehyde dehydrogenase